MWQAVGFFRLFRIPPPKTKPPRYSWSIVESGVKHHKTPTLTYWYICVGRQHYHLWYAEMSMYLILNATTYAVFSHLVHSFIYIYSIIGNEFVLVLNHLFSNPLVVCLYIMYITSFLKKDVVYTTYITDVLSWQRCHTFISLL